MDAVIECGVARALSASTIMFGGMKATAFVFGGVYASKKAKTAGWEDVALNISKDETTSSYNVNGRVL